MRLAWFSPMPPVRTGVAAVSAALVAAFSREHVVDVYTDAASGSGGGQRSAHDFVWRHRQHPYDLIVYQVGNSSHHDYIWPYLFRYPGLTVLHDAHLHHARAATLLRTKRVQDYRAEFAANDPEANPDLAELAVAGFDNHLYYSWPMTRLVIEASRMTAVHSRVLAASLRDAHPAARIASICLAHGEPAATERARAARTRVRDAHGIPPSAILFGVFGSLTPEKRLPQILDALDAVVPYVPSAHLLLAGAPAQHFDVKAAVRGRGLDARTTMTGYVPEDELLDHILACDVSLNLRWPTAREMSGPWLRALAAGLPTIITDLAHLADVPSLDPRTWRVNEVANGDSRLAAGRDPANREPRTAHRDPITVAIDILDEDHSLRLAMRRLATDAQLRAWLGTNARTYWEREHSTPRMVEDYRRIIVEATSVPPPKPVLPAHLVNDGDATLRRLLGEFGLRRENVFGLHQP